MTEAMERRGNPWLTEHEPLPMEREPVRPAPVASGPRYPQPGLVEPPEHGLPVMRLSPLVDQPPPPWWWLGCHGGAGVSTLSVLIPGGLDAMRSWPLAEHLPQRVVLVARTSAVGLKAAQSAARQWASGQFSADVLGLVLVADAPGKLPRSLREIERLVSGGVARTWHVPWINELRLGTYRTPKPPAEIVGLAADLHQIITGGN